MDRGEAPGSTWFQRFLLPGFAFKAVVIGGGYATGRELAEFFLPSGAWGGLAAMALSTVILIVSASAASREFRPREALVVGVLLAALAVGVFVVGLQLQLPIWPGQD